MMLMGNALLAALLGVLVVAGAQTASAGDRYRNEDVVNWDQQHPGLMLAMSTVLAVKGTLEGCQIRHPQHYETIAPATTRARRWEQSLAKRFKNALGKIILRTLQAKRQTLNEKLEESDELTKAHCLSFAENVMTKDLAPELQPFLAASSDPH